MSFATALAKKHETNVSQYKPPAKAIPVLPTLRVDIRLDKKELHVTGIENFTLAHQEFLLNRGFQWQIGSNIFIAPYTADSCEVLKSLGVEIDPPYVAPTPTVEIRETPTAAPKNLFDDVDEEEEEGEEKTPYMLQVDALCKHFKLYPADLCKFAIEALYSRVCAGDGIADS